MRPASTTSRSRRAFSRGEAPEGRAPETLIRRTLVRTAMPSQRADEEEGIAPPRLPPARSGPKVLAVIAALLLVFLGVLWYASFVALNARGPDRAFFTKESWENGTVLLTLTELDEKGEVLASTLTLNITSPAGASLYAGALGQTFNHTNYTLTVELLDNDRSTTLTRGDQLRISATPPEASDILILSTLYLYSNGREWARFLFE